MGGTMVLGIGNRLCGDDGAGSYVVKIINQRQKRGKASIFAKTSPIVAAIDAGTAPESYTSVIRQRRPDLLILVDAADMGLPPGSLRIIPREKISILSFSTHRMPLSVFVPYVAEFCEKVTLVGLQPERTQVGEGVSKTVRKGTKQLAEAILEGRVAEIPLLE